MDNEKRLITVQSLITFIGSLGSIFLNIYLFKNGNFGTVMLYNGTNFLFLILTYILSGYFLHVYSARRLTGIGLAGTMIFWCGMFLLGSSSIHHVILLGSIMGLSQGCFWSGINLMQYIMTHDESRNRYFGRTFALANFSRTIAPGIGGFIVSMANGYSILFLLMAILYFLSGIILGRLPRVSGIHFSVSHILHHSRTVQWKRILVQQSILGLWDSSYSTVIMIIIYMTFSSEFSVGIIASVATLSLGLGSFFAPKVLRHYPQAPVIASGIAGAGLLIFTVTAHPVPVVIISIIVGLTLPIVQVPVYSAMLRVIDQQHLPWQHSYHMLIERDVVLSLSRTLSYVILMVLFVQFGKTDVALWWMKFIAVLPLTLALLLRKHNS